MLRPGGYEGPFNLGYPRPPSDSLDKIAPNNIIDPSMKYPLAPTQPLIRHPQARKVSSIVGGEGSPQ